MYIYIYMYSYTHRTREREGPRVGIHLSKVIMAQALPLYISLQRVYVVNRICIGFPLHTPLQNISFVTPFANDSHCTPFYIICLL